MNYAFEDLHLVVGKLGFHCVRAGPASGPPVMLLHGFPEHWWSWRHQMPLLAAAGFQVVAVDMRGYGLSDAPRDVREYRLDQLVSDIVGLAEQMGWARFDLVGHDWGGIVGWAVAAGHPLVVKNLVVINAPHLDAMPEVVFRRPWQLLRSAYVGFFQIPWLPEIMLAANGHRILKNALTSTSRRGTFSESDLDRYAVEWARRGRLRSMINYYRALVREPRDPLGRIVPPTLLLWGCQDQALDPELAQASLLKCANGWLSSHRGATHWVHLEEPSWVATKIIDFLHLDKETDLPEPGRHDETL